MSVIDMRALRAVLAALLLLGALSVHFNSDIVDEWADGQRSNEDDNGLSLLGVQSEERWLVLQVKFPNNQYPTSTASEILIGQGSAEEYVEQMTGGSSSLSARTRAPHRPRSPLRVRGPWT